MDTKIDISATKLQDEDINETLRYLFAVDKTEFNRLLLSAYDISVDDFNELGELIALIENSELAFDMADFKNSYNTLDTNIANNVNIVI